MNPTSLFHGGVDVSRFCNILSTSITPFDVSGILFLEDGDDLPIDDNLPVLSIDCTVELGIGRIILEYVDYVVEVNEGSLVATIFTFLDKKAFLVTKLPTQPNPSTLTFTIVSKVQGWHCKKMWLSRE